MLLRGYYRDGDYEAMHRLDLSCFAPAFQFNSQTIKEAAEADSAIVVVAEDVSRAMEGFIILHLERSGEERFAYIITIDVAPGARLRGVGSGMLSHAEAQACAAGASRVSLHVAVDNKDAIRFYRHHKYVQIGLSRNFYSEAGLDALILGKRLDRQDACGGSAAASASL